MLTGEYDNIYERKSVIYERKRKEAYVKRQSNDVELIIYLFNSF